MSGSERREDVQLLLQEAAYRLNGAVENAPREGEDARIGCENAHDAIEVSLNAVIVASGEKYRASHDLSELADVAAEAGEPIPAELNGIRELRPYTGGGRYSYRHAGHVDPATKSDYDQIVNLAQGTYAWAGSRARELCSGRPPQQATQGRETGKQTVRDTMPEHPSAMTAEGGPDGASSAERPKAASPREETEPTRHRTILDD